MFSCLQNLRIHVQLIRTHLCDVLKNRLFWVYVCQCHHMVCLIPINSYCYLQMMTHNTQLCTYSRRQNKVSVPFALHGERSENGDITVEKTVSKTVVKRYLNGAKTVTRKTEAVKILRDHTCCPRGSSLVCTSKTEEHLGSAKGATGKL